MYRDLLIKTGITLFLKSKRLSSCIPKYTGRGLSSEDMYSLGIILSKGSTSEKRLSEYLKRQGDVIEKDREFGGEARWRSEWVLGEITKGAAKRI